MSDARKDLLNKGVEAALELAKTNDWRDLTLSAIAERAGLSLKDFHGVADKAKISDAVEDWLDDAMSEGFTSEGETPRTRLFDVIMMRFDRMEEHREAMLSLVEWRQTQPPVIPPPAGRSPARASMARATFQNPSAPPPSPGRWRRPR